MYFITAFVDLNPHSSGRCFGYLETFEEADQALKENWYDMYEYTYSYAIIEKIKPGIHSICVGDDRWFYKYNRDIDSFEPIPEPKELEHICNFAIG